MKCPKCNEDMDFEFYDDDNRLDFIAYIQYCGCCEKGIYFEATPYNYQIEDKFGAILNSSDADLIREAFKDDWEDDCPPALESNG
jgi:hypothetical protein